MTGNVTGNVTGNLTDSESKPLLNWPRNIRVFSPENPFKRSGGSPHVILDGVLSFLRLGFDVELIVLEDVDPDWRDDRRLIGLPLSGLRVRSYPVRSPESRWSRAFRVARSLFSDHASPEAVYYPGAEVYRAALRRGEFAPVDWEIFHYSFAHSWVKELLGFSGASRLARRRVVVFHNLESELFEERARGRIGASSWIHGRSARKLRAHEGELLEWVDEVWMISPEDEARLRVRLTEETARSQGAKALIRYVSPTFQSSFASEDRGALRGQEKGPVFGIIGAMDFHPNHASVEWLLKEVCPKLKKAGFSGQIWIAGKGASKSLRSLGNDFEFVKFLGFVENSERFWGALSASLVPHLTGSGVRIKLLESLARGVPVFANAAATGRIHPQLRLSPLLIESDDPHEWARRMLAWFEGPNASLRSGEGSSEAEGQDTPDTFSASVKILHRQGRSEVSDRAVLKDTVRERNERERSMGGISTMHQGKLPPELDGTQVYRFLLE